MIDDTAHNISEFGNFPWGLLMNSLDWKDVGHTSSGFQVNGISLGGVVANVDFNPRQPHIDFLRTDGSISVDAWAVPEALEQMVTEFYNRGKRDRESEIRKQTQDLALTLLGNVKGLQNGS